MAETLRSKDYRFILICLLVCGVSLFVGTHFFYRAFPEASIDFHFNKMTSEPLAEQFLAGQGFATKGYRHASVFHYDDETKVFMERELGLEKANALMKDEVKIWRWGHRWFKPLQKEELRVDITPTGEVASFAHVLPEEAAGQDLPPDAARALAESFLVLDMKRPIDSLEFLDSQVEKRPHRTDHIFTWRVLGVALHDASYRVSVTIQGDRVDGYNEFVWIPEEWSRGYARLRSHNETTSQVDLLFLALLGVAMLAVLGRRVRMRDVPWKTALVFGAIAFALQFFSSLNEFPLAEFDFDTTGTFGSFVGQSAIRAALGALGFGGIIFLLTACAEPLYRQAYPQHISIRKMISWQAIRTRSFFVASLVGITLTFFFFAYEIGFYLLANKLGAWAPADIPYTDLLNTRLPWIFVLLGGFFPAVSEEWMFRAFSIPYLQQILRYRWLAVFLASFIWGFGHANYPNQPFFIRGIEVGIVGLILSWAMIRFGVVSTLIAHYSIDAFYSAFLLLRSGNPYLVASGAATAGINLFPFLLAAGAYVATRRFHSESPTTNRDVGSAPALAPETLPPESVRITYVPMTRRAFIAGFLLLAIGGAAMFLLPQRFGDTLRFRIPAAEAARSAGRFLSDLKFSLQSYRRVTQPVERVDGLAAQYIYTQAGVQGLNRMYSDRMIPLAWETRFYRPLQKEEFRVDTDPGNGRVVAFRHLLPEEAPGADLPESQAKTIGSSFLESQGYDLAQFELKETHSEKPKQRRDTDFTWEALTRTSKVIGEARLRVEAGVLGDKIGNWSQRIKIPEEWTRDRERRGPYRIVAGATRAFFFIAAFSIAAVILIRAARQGQVRWKLARRVAGIAMLLELINVLNFLPEFFFQYDTRVEMQEYVLTGLVGSALSLIGIGIAAFVATGLILACYPDVPALLHKENIKRWSRDAAAASAAALGCFLMLEWIIAQIHSHAHRLALAPSLSIPDNIGTYVPFISNLRDVLLSALFFSTVLAFGTYLWRKLAGRVWLRGILLAALLVSFLPPAARHFSEAAFDLVPSVLLIAVATLLVIFFLRDNYAGYILSAAIISVARKSISLIGQGNLGLTVQGCLLWALVAAGMAWLFMQNKSKNATDPTY